MPRQSRGWQFSLRALLLLVLLIGAYFGGFVTARRIDEKAIRQAHENTAETRNAQQEAELKSRAAVAAIYRTARQGVPWPRDGPRRSRAPGLPRVPGPSEANAVKVLINQFACR
jgi:hypothetical protein